MDSPAAPAVRVLAPAVPAHPARVDLLVPPVVAMEDVPVVRPVAMQEVALVAAPAAAPVALAVPVGVADLESAVAVPTSVVPVGVVGTSKSSSRPPSRHTRPRRHRCPTPKSSSSAARQLATSAQS